ncbi:hypothetical protein SDJN03_05531, partial [Cucurbita argyrosperma subsp. sororia]
MTIVGCIELSRVLVEKNRSVKEMIIRKVMADLPILMRIVFAASPTIETLNISWNSSSKLARLIGGEGNYVVQHVIEASIEGATKCIVRRLAGRFSRLAKSKIGSNVVESIAQDPHGNYVPQTALEQALPGGLEMFIRTWSNVSMFILQFLKPTYLEEQLCRKSVNLITGTHSWTNSTGRSDNFFL